ncbi:protein mono-ADP-ribosyltransferase PARP14-like [Glandiceps talaboti]
MDKRSFLLEGLPDSYEKEDLELYLESRTRINDVPELFFGETPGPVLVRYPKEIKDFDDIAKRIASRQFKGEKLVAKLVEVSNCVVVKHLSPNIELQTLEMYFESRRSGGGDVYEVNIDKERSMALVFFKDHKVVNSVLHNKHTLRNVSLEVLPYHQCIRQVFTQRELLEIPGPMTVPVDPDLFTYIRSEQPYLDDLSEEISHVHGELVIKDDNLNDKVEVKSTLTKNTPDVYGLVKEWTKDVQKTILDYFKQFSSEKMPVNEGIWQLVKSKMEDISTRNVKVGMDDDTSSIAIIGKVDDVSVVMVNVSDLVSDIEKEVDKQRKRLTEAVKLEHVKVKQLIMSKFSTEVGEKVPEVDVKIEEKNCTVTFHGQRNDITEAKCLMYEAMDKCTVLKFKPPLVLYEFMKTPHVSDELYKILKQVNINAAISFEEDEVP